MKQPTITFQNYLDRFPLVTLPVTLSEESHHDFSERNDPLSKEMIEQFIIPHEQQTIDEFTEYVPCLRFEEIGMFTCVLFWRAMLMNYDYILHTYNHKGMWMDQERIAGTKARDNQILISIATIDEDYIIDILEGGRIQSESYNPNHTRTYHYEILEDGKILRP